MSSMARVIFMVDWTDRIRRRTSRSFAPIPLYSPARYPGSCTPPVINSVTAAPSVIFPPNHKMVLVTVFVDATATCGPPVCKIVSPITFNEPSRERDDADDRDERSDDDDKARPDTRIVSDFTAEVRAVRAGGSLGRTYTITVACTDTAGNAATKDTHVFVPHDQRK